LSLNSNGNIAWQDFNEFKNHRTFNYVPGTVTWTVPVGVTRIMVEGWGGGGGYVCVWFTVTTGDVVTFQIGNRGFGGDNTNPGTNGGTTSISTLTGSVQALGGSAGIYYTGGGDLGRGGSYVITTNSIGMPGEEGKPNRYEYYQSNATTYLEAATGGKGGDAG